jgi:hypothetical protein
MGLSSVLVLVIVSMTNIYLLALCVVSGYAILVSVSSIFMSMREIKRIANTVKGDEKTIRKLSFERVGPKE